MTLSSTVWPQTSFLKFSSHSLPILSSSSSIYPALSYSRQLICPQTPGIPSCLWSLDCNIRYKEQFHSYNYLIRPVFSLPDR